MLAGEHEEDDEVVDVPINIYQHKLLIKQILGKYLPDCWLAGCVGVKDKKEITEQIV